MNSIDIIDECVAEKEDYTVTVGVIENSQPRFIVFGGGGAILAPIEHEYELYGTTQCFTAALAQKLISINKLSLQSPISAFVKNIPTDKDFTVQELLTHTSGILLPLSMRLKLYASSFNPKINLTQNIDRPALLEILKRCRLKKNGRSCPNEINTALLGEIISEAGEKPYSEQLISFINSDLKLSGFKLSGESGEPRAVYTKRGKHDSFIAANGIVAKITSCLRFLELALNKNDLLNICISTACEEKTVQGYSVGLGWIISRDKLAWQSGTGSAFNSFFGIDFVNNRAVCVLSNSAAREHQSAAEAGLLYLRERQQGRELVFM